MKFFGSSIAVGAVCLCAATNVFGQACADVTASWTDGAGGGWTIAQDTSTGALTGLYGAPPGGACTQGQQYVITSGRYTGSGGFTATVLQTGAASGGSTNPNCAASITITGTMQGPACSSASVHWSNGVFSGGQTWSSQCLKPSGETIPTFDHWRAFSDTYPDTTLAVFNTYLTSGPSEFYGWGGHTLAETFPDPSVDSCYWFFSAIPHAANGYPAPAFILPDRIPAQYTDGIGADSATINYFRRTGKTPCSVTFYQTMNAVCPTGNQPYFHNTLRVEMGSSTITSTRGPSVPETKNWGTPAYVYQTIPALSFFAIGPM